VFKYLLTVLYDYIYLLNLDQLEILHENTRHVKLYCGKLSGRMVFGNKNYFRWSKLLNEYCRIC
jgi:hypothetical protein